MNAKARKSELTNCVARAASVRGDRARGRGRRWSAASLAAARAFRGFIFAGTVSARTEPRGTVGGRKRPAEIARLVCAFYLE